MRCVVLLKTAMIKRAYDMDWNTFCQRLRNLGSRYGINLTPKQGQVLRSDETGSRAEGPLLSSANNAQEQHATGAASNITAPRRSKAKHRVERRKRRYWK